MSTPFELEELHADRAPVSSGRAQAWWPRSWESAMATRSVEVLEQDMHGPLRLRERPMDKTYTWRRVLADRKRGCLMEMTDE